MSSSQNKNESNKINHIDSLFNSKLFFDLENKSFENDKDTYISDDSFESKEYDINDDYFLLNDLIKQINSSGVVPEENKYEKNYLSKNKFNSILFSQNINYNFTSLNCGENGIIYNRKKRNNFKERKGDWICMVCNNLNFAFRTQCNKCKSLKENSVKKIF